MTRHQIPEGPEVCHTIIGSYEVLTWSDSQLSNSEVKDGYLLQNVLSHTAAPSYICVGNETDKVTAVANDGRLWRYSSHILELVLR